MEFPTFPFPPAVLSQVACVLALAASATPAPAAAPATSLPAGTTLKTAADGRQNLRFPAAFAFDDHGRLLVTESHRTGHGVRDDATHPEWIADDLAARTHADRLALLEKWCKLVPEVDLTKKSGQVRRLADVDGDGVFEQSRDFAQGFNHALDSPAAGILCSGNGVWFGCVPKLWRLTDTDGDGTAEERKELLDGFGVRTFSGAHGLGGLTLGPDGRIWGTIGDCGLTLTTSSGAVMDYPGTGCAFRCELDGSGFEVFHTGLCQPTGVAFDALGNPFTVDAPALPGEPARLIYLVDGGDSGWRMEYRAMRDFPKQLGLPENPPTPWLTEHMAELQHASRPAYCLPPVALLPLQPTSLAAHPGTGFLEAEAGRFLIGADGKKPGIWSFAMQPEGAGMKLADLRPLVGGLAATAIGFSWDGRLFIAERDQHRISTLDAGAHTWWAAEAANAAKIIRDGLDKADSTTLAALLKHADARVRMRAQLALTRMPDAAERFATASSAADLTERLHGIWGLGILARRGGGVPVVSADGFGDIPDQKTRLVAGQNLVLLLTHADPETRAQALRALAEAENRFVRPTRLKDRGKQVDPFMSIDELPLASLLGDPAPRVAYFAAIAIGRFKAATFYSPVLDFLKTHGDRDPYLRHAGGFALQGIAANPALLAGLDAHPSVAVRLGATVGLRLARNPWAGNCIGDPDPTVAAEAIRAVTDLGLDEVRPMLAMLLDMPPAAPWSPLTQRRVLHNAYRLGTAENAARLVKRIGDPVIAPELQLEIISLLQHWGSPPPVDPLTGQWRPLPKRDAAELKPVLAAELPRLLKLTDPLRAAVLDLAKQLKLETPAAPTPDKGK